MSRPAPRPPACPACGHRRLVKHCPDGPLCDWWHCPACKGFGTTQRWAEGRDGPKGSKAAS